MHKLIKPNLYLIAIAILLFIAGEANLLQHTFGLTEPEEIVVLILLATTMLWVSEVIPLYITSLGVLFFSVIWLLPSLQSHHIDAEKNDFLIAFFSDITLLFMGGFVLAALMSKYGISKRIANYILRRSGTSPSRVLLAIIIVSALLSMWLSNTATAAMMFAIMVPVVTEIPDTSKFKKAIALGIPFACNIGGIGTPIGTPPNAIAMGYLDQSGISISFMQWMLMAIPLVILLTFLLWKILLKFYPAGDIKLNFETKHLDQLGNRQKLVVVIALIAILGWLTSGMTGISSGFVGLFIVLIAFGSQLLHTDDFKRISWDVLFMLGGGLCLGVGLKLSGLTDTIASLISVDSGELVLLLVLLIVSAVMTTFMSNTATANLLIPIAISVPHGELLFSVAIALMCSSSMALPISTPPNAIAYGSGYFDTKDMMFSGLTITALALIGILVICLFYLPLFA